MLAPQGLIAYPGITPADVVSFSFTFTHGIGPSVCTIYMAPRLTTILKVGTLEIQYGSTRILFPRCTADKLRRERSADGRELWAVPIYDRRWAWKFAGRVSGYYNVRRDCVVTEEKRSERGTETRKIPGTTIMPGTEKSPRDLAKLCLEAMGEERFDLSEMPDELRPEIAWDYALPAEALARLADSVGCRVVLRLNDTVAILPAGKGKTLFADHLATDGGIELDSPERPDKIVVATAPIRYQANFDLEAVGRDTDGSIKPIDDLSYTPEHNGKRSWGALDIADCSAVKDPKARVYARETVFRWYRIKTPLKLPGVKDEIATLDRILPLTDRQVETWTVETGLYSGKVERRIEPRPAWVYGQYVSDRTTALLSDEEKRAKAEDAKIDDDVTDKPKTLYLGSFSIDRETGIVKFGEPVYRLSEHQPDKEKAEFSGGEALPAKLRLRVAVNLRDKDTRGWVRYEVQRKLDGGKTGTEPRYIVKDDVELNYWLAQGEGSEETAPKDNLAEVKKQAEYYLDAIEKEYQADTPASVGYAGIVAIDPDGAIQQVTWAVDGQGFATTRASRNREEPVITPTYKERRMLERLQEEAKAAEKTARQKEQEQKRARA